MFDAELVQAMNDRIPSMSLVVQVELRQDDIIGFPIYLVSSVQRSRALIPSPFVLVIVFTERAWTKEAK